MGAGLKLPDLEQGVRLDLGVPDLVVHEVVSAEIVEGMHQHSLLTAQLRVGGDLATAFKVLGQPVSFGVFGGMTFDSLFAGTVDEIDISGSRLTITAMGGSLSRDEEARIDSYGDGAEPMAVNKLPGIDRLLKGVKQSSKLTRAVLTVSQFGSTDFSLLCRLADFHGLLVVAPSIGDLRLTDGKDGPEVKVDASSILPGTERVQARRGRASGAECLTWDLGIGDAPAKAARGESCPADTGLLGGIVARLAGANLRHRLLTSTVGGNLSDAEKASAFGKAARGGLVRYWATLGYAHRGVGVGTRLQLEDHAIREELLVVRRRLSYRPGMGRPDEQLRNSIECTPSSFPPVGAPSPLSGPVVALLGRVLDVADPAGRARVKVSFPHHKDKEGIWCPSPQSFGGDVDGRHNGAVDLPSVNDWVACLGDPMSFEPPLVLGSVYAGKARGKAPKRPSPAEERVLFRSSDGAELRVSGGGQAGVTLAMVGSDGKTICRFALKADGAVFIDGSSLTLQAKEIQVKGKAEFKGSLNVKKEA